jgi:hypothetical protein
MYFLAIFREQKFCFLLTFFILDVEKTRIFATCYDFICVRRFAGRNVSLVYAVNFSIIVVIFYAFLQGENFVSCN